MKWSFQHVYCNQDDNTNWLSLSLLERLNIKVDNIAKNAVKSAYKDDRRFFNYTLLDYLSRVFVGTDRIQPISQLAKTLSKYTRQRKIREYRIVKKHYLVEFKNTIDWRASELASKKILNSRWKWLDK